MSGDPTLEGSDSGTKSSSAKSAQIADRRLIEYFVTVSSVELDGDTSNLSQEANGDLSFQEWKTESGGSEEELFAAYQFRPTLTSRYPLVDHPDNPLHDNVIFFCHPSGKIRLRTQHYMPKVCTHACMD